MAFLFVFVLGRRVRALIRGFLGLDWPYILFTWSPHIYFIVVYIVVSSMTSERIQRSEKGGEAGSDPRGHLWVTWGVYLWAGKPPLADIILSHPPDRT